MRLALGRSPRRPLRRQLPSREMSIPHEATASNTATPASQSTTPWLSMCGGIRPEKKTRPPSPGTDFLERGR